MCGQSPNKYTFLKNGAKFILENLLELYITTKLEKTLYSGQNFTAIHTAIVFSAAI